MILCNNPRALKNRKHKRGTYFLFDYESRTLKKTYKRLYQVQEDFPSFQRWEIQRFLHFKLIFEGCILTHFDDPNFDQYTPYIRKYKTKKRERRFKQFQAFIEDKESLGRIQRGIPFFSSYCGFQKRYKPQYVLTDEEALENGLEPCFPQSRFYISKKHVMYLKHNDLYYKLDMID